MEFKKDNPFVKAMRPGESWEALARRAGLSTIWIKQIAKYVDNNPEKLWNISLGMTAMIKIKFGFDLRDYLPEGEPVWPRKIKIV